MGQHWECCERPLGSTVRRQPYRPICVQERGEEKECKRRINRAFKVAIHGPFSQATDSEEGPPATATGEEEEESNERVAPEQFLHLRFGSTSQTRFTSEFCFYACNDNMTLEFSFFCSPYGILTVEITGGR